MKRKALRVLLWTVLGLFALIAVAAALSWTTVQRILLGGVKVYETTPPALPAAIRRPAVLVFSKTNGFRHDEAIPAANALLAQMAKDSGWGYFQTENGATFSPTILARFDAVVFNNVSGDVFTPEQRQAFKNFLENGGGFVGIHASGGDFTYNWRWYVRDLIGAQFSGHPANPQFQEGVVRIEDKSHPATKNLPNAWKRIDEWYSFETSARRPGYHILLTLDEGTYANRKMLGMDISMGMDHPIAWWHCVGKGRALYSAMGHQASAYAEPEHRKLLQGAIEWALKKEGPACLDPAGTAK